MKPTYALLILLFFYISGVSQTYRYKYYLDKDLASIDSGSALFIGKGYKENNAFLLDCFEKGSGILFMSAHFKDSSLSMLEGAYQSFYENHQIEQTGNYVNNAAQGLWITHDTMGRITDSLEFNNGFIVSTRKYDYYVTGKVRSYSITNSSGVQELFLFYNEDGTVMKDKQGQDMVFTKTEIEAEFPGGSLAWRKFLEKNMRVPDPWMNKTPTGQYTVIVRFIVDKEGKVSDIAAETNIGYGMEQEVMRLIKISQNWKPAMQNGQTVRAYRRQPVTFFIDNGDR